MSIPLTINGITFNYPSPLDVNWGPVLDGWSTAVTNGMLQTGGSNAANLIKSASGNTASIGFLRLAHGDSIDWRNNANSGDLALSVNSSDQLVFNGNVLAAGGTVNAGTQYQLGYYATSSNAISGLTLITANMALESDSNGLPIASGVTSTELGYVSGVTSSIQTQLTSNATVANNALPKTGGTMSGAINMGGNKITALANGTASTDAAAFGQLSTFTPSGLISMYGGSVAPSGWLLCDGSSYSTASQPNLFAVIGYTFGGSGSNFNVPFMTDRVAIGAGSVAALGATAGSNTHAIAQSELPVSIGTANSVVTDPGHLHLERVNLAGAGSGVGISPTGPSLTFQNTNVNTATATTGITVATTITNAGGGNAMSLVQASLGLTYIIKA